MSLRPLLAAGLLVLTAVFFPGDAAQAHGGVRQIAGDTVVTNIQSPLSPLATEPVRFDYVFTSLAGRQLTGKALTVNLIDTYTGAPVTTKRLTTDVNGLATITHTFTRSGVFDAEINFTDGNGQPHTAGFMVQVRSQAGPSVAWWHYIAAAATGAALPLYFLLHRHRKTKRRN